MLADRLTTSEREQLLNEKPMVNFQSQQWDKAPKAHIQDHVPPHTILNKIMVRCRNEKQPLERNKKYYRIGYSIAATVAIFIIGFWIANNISSSDINISAPMNDKLAVMLPDSSEVWLNAASQLKIFIDRLINSLPEQQRKCFLLSREENLSYKEIAERLGISQKTVEIHMGKALKFLKDKVKRGWEILLSLLSF